MQPIRRKIIPQVLADLIEVRALLRNEEIVFAENERFVFD